MTALPDSPPLGEDRRDWTLLWRLAMLALAGSSTLIGGVILYAGESYVRRHASAVVAEAVMPLADLPPRMKRIEEIATERAEKLRTYDAQHTRVDVAIQRLTGLAENQQRQLDRQQVQLDRLEQLIRARSP